MGSSILRVGGNMENEVLNISFDQYTRNRIIGDIVTIIKSKNPHQIIKVLDVGGRNGKLNLFLDDFEYYILDMMEKGDDSGHYIKGDSRNIPFKSKSFDVVISTDMYEHLAPADRVLALNDMLRVSKNHIILCGPFYSPEAERAEVEDNEYFTKVTGKEHPWLKEHIENTLPHEEELQSFLIERKLDYVKIGSNNVSNWFLMQLLISYAQNYEVPQEDMIEIHKYYNQNFAEVGDFLEPTYRKIYVIGNAGTVPEININSMYNMANPLKRQELTAKIFYALLHGAINRDNYTKQQETYVSHKEAYIKHLEGVVHSKDEAIIVYQNKMQSLEEDIDSIHQSITWQIESKLQNYIINPALPLGSRRRTFYDRILKSGRIILKEGIRSYIKKYGQYKKDKKTNGVDKAYEQWIRENEPNDTELLKQKVHSRYLSYRPLVSIITPTYNTPPKVLEEMIKSVINQTYDHWELCIVDGNSKDEIVRTILRKYSQRDARVKVKFLSDNLGISGNTNQAVDMATGEYIALLDHDDLLAPFALYEVVSQLNKDPELDFIYSDKDMITEDSKIRFHPFFKPDWSPDIMLSANYLTHLCIIKRSLLEEIGGFLKETDGAQDWDMFLRIIDSTNKIAHIPKVLYHWRTIDTSCAKNGGKAKPYIFDAQRKSLESHIQRMGLKANFTFNPPGIWEVQWILSKKWVASVIIPSHDRKVTERCINSIISNTLYQHYEIIVVESSERDNYSETYSGGTLNDSRIKFVKYNGSSNYPAMVNTGLKNAIGDAIVLLNENLEVITPGWIENMIGWLEQDSVGAVGAKVLGQDYTIRQAGWIMGVNGLAGSPFMGVVEYAMTPYGYTEWYRDYKAVSGNCMAIRKKLFEEMNGLDEELKEFGSDIDLCLRLSSKNYRIVYTPFVKFKCNNDSTNNLCLNDSNITALHTRYQPLLNGNDPYYNVNLSKRDMTPGIKLSSEE
jgi:glycosyltransferase involved in cell wall biosynthesis